MDFPIADVLSAKRINVVGVTGSGKSTLTRQLAQLKQIPHYEMDRLFWLPNWQEVSDDLFAEKLAQVVAEPEWVLDGNYKRTTPLKWSRAEVVVWIDLPFLLTFMRLFGRCVDRAWSKKELWPGTGNRETFRKMFFSRDSILVWLLKTYRSSCKFYTSAMQNESYAHITFIHLQSSKSVTQFLESLGVRNKILGRLLIP